MQWGGSRKVAIAAYGMSKFHQAGSFGAIPRGANFSPRPIARGIWAPRPVVNFIWIARGDISNRHAICTGLRGGALGHRGLWYVRYICIPSEMPIVAKYLAPRKPNPRTIRRGFGRSGRMFAAPMWANSNQRVISTSLHCGCVNALWQKCENRETEQVATSPSRHSVCAIYLHCFRMGHCGGVNRGHHALYPRTIHMVGSVGWMLGGCLFSTPTWGFLSRRQFLPLCKSGMKGLSGQNATIGGSK